MAILSEVAQRQTHTSADATLPALAEIAETSRTLVDSMSDIVWSIDPHRDDLGNLLVRVREFASDMFEGRSIAWTLDGPEDAARIRLDPEERRHLFLVIKEAITNIVRHAGATKAAITVAVTDGNVHVRISDNGDGFSVPAGSRGHGLRNIDMRVRQLNGHASIDSQPGSGSVVSLSVPLR
jgi:signal transduction histidine kinase